MVLAAGRGERMRPLTDTTPKPLLQVGAEPLIGWHLRRLAAAGVCQVVVNHAHLGAQIEARLGDGAAWGVQLAYSAEPRALETAGGIATALPLLGNAPFLVVNGDVLTDIDFKAAFAAAEALQAGNLLAHLWLVDNPPHNSSGDFALQTDGKVASDTAAGHALTFSGMGVYQPALFRHTPRHQPAKLAPLLREAMNESRVSGSRHAGLWLDVGTVERLAEADALVQSGRIAAP